MQSLSNVTGLAAFLLIAPLITASASPPPVDVTPDYIKPLPYSFVFTSKDRDGTQQVGITVTPKKVGLSPGPLARLYLFDDKAEIANVPYCYRIPRIWFGTTAHLPVTTGLPV